MSRDLVLAVLTLGVCGPLLWLSGLAHRGRVEGGTGSDLERRLWRRLWAPLFPAMVALALLAGWGLQEPHRTDELLSSLSLAFVTPVAAVWLRAAFRAVRALGRHSARVPAATVGLLNPRVVVDPDLQRALDRRTLNAVLAHERAHVSHRDPLRIWLAQIATDVQWPATGAGARLDAWLGALEVSRDEEARRAGSDGQDLAAAILFVARWAHRPSTRAIALLTAAERNLVARIERLLAPLPAELQRGRSWRLPVIILIAICASLLVGVACGDTLVRALPIVSA